MAAAPQLLQDLAVVMGAAALIAVLFKRLRLPLLFGFLAAGILIGPHNPYFHLVGDRESLQTLADLGVILLLFGLGLSFSFRGLRRYGGVSFIVMVTQALLMLWLGFEVGNLIGWSTLDSVFLGATLSISSTTIAVKVLRDLNRLEGESSQIMFGVLILQDIAAVLILVLLSGYAATGGVEFGEVGVVLARMALFLLITVLLGLLVVPRLVDYVARQHGNELLVLATLGLAFGFSMLSAAVGFHPGLGAFFIGALVAEAKTRDRVEQQLRPVSDMFTALFFVSIGTLLDLAVLRAFWAPVLAIFLLVVVGKLVSGAAGTFLSGYAPATAMAVGTGLAQIGEFSFVIAALGQSAGVTGEALFPTVIGVALLTSLASPLLIQLSERLTAGLGRLAPAHLRTYANVYVSWMASFRARAGPTQRARQVRARRGVIVGALVVVTAMGTAWFFQGAGRKLLEDQNLREPSTTLTYWGLVLALLIPLLYQLYRSVNRWIDTWAFPSTVARGGLRLRQVAKYTFYLLGAILLGLPVLAATAPFFRTPLIALAWFAMVGSAAVILWASIGALHSRIETHVQALLDDEHVPLRAPQVVRDLLTSEFPWELKVESFELEAATWAAGKRLGELNLRAATGASLILIERGEYREQTPGPETVLLPGDRLTLIGSRDEVGNARAVLERRSTGVGQRPELRLGRLYIAEGSELEGVKLSEAALPTRSGLQVVAIVREERAIQNPGANEKFRPGDVVLVLGSQEQIAAATSRTTPRPPAEPGAPDKAERASA